MDRLSAILICVIILMFFYYFKFLRKQQEYILTILASRSPSPKINENIIPSLEYPNNKNVTTSEDYSLLFEKELVPMRDTLYTKNMLARGPREKRAEGHRVGIQFDDWNAMKQDFNESSNKTEPWWDQINYTVT